MKILKTKCYLKRLSGFIFLLIFLFFFQSQTQSPPHIPSGINCDISGMAPFVQVPGVGWEGQGAGVAYADLNNNGKQDMVLMAYDNPSGGNTFRYKVGWDINMNNGQASSWTDNIHIAGVGWEGQGAGIAIGDINNNGKKDMILMTYDNPAGANTFRYKIGWDIKLNGKAQSWSNTFFEAGPSDEGSGAGIYLADINKNGTIDLVLMASVQKDGLDNFRYKIGWDLNANGQASSWSSFIYGPGVGHSIQGADVVVTDVNLDDNLDIVVMAYDNPHWNNFRYRIGWSVQTNGYPLDWSRWFVTKGVGTEGQGAGMDVINEPNGRSLLTLMAYDNPSGGNSFRYMILPLTTSGTTYGIADDAPPYPNNALQVPNSNTQWTADRLLNLNMKTVQDAAYDAITLHVFNCLIIGIMGKTEDNPNCWCNYPENKTNVVVSANNARLNYSITPDMLVNAVAWYVDENMGYVGDEINSFVLNDIHNLNYFTGAEKIPAYYTVHYTNPARHSNLISALQARDPAWANQYNDGNKFHGDCEDFAILRHALLRALSFDRDYIWNAGSPGHEFNIVLYQGSYRIMDYGHIYNYFCKPSGITKDVYRVWNQSYGPQNDQKKTFEDQVLGKIYPDRCTQSLGWMFTRRTHSEYDSK
jgi:hypothetical protein